MDIYVQQIAQQIAGKGEDTDGKDDVAIRKGSHFPVNFAERNKKVE